MPPTMTFVSKMWHPNGTLDLFWMVFCVGSNDTFSVYPDGKVCISILHPPGEDVHNELVTHSMRACTGVSYCFALNV
jgi:ubiquitin-protein ligase